MNWYKQLKFRTKHSAFSSNVEYLGYNFIRRISHAAGKEKWGLRILQLAWTAGPVTFLALQGGYLLGYGKSAPLNLIIYFAFYTVFTGILAIIIKFIYQMTRGKEIEKLEEAINQAFIRLPDIILFTRNETLNYYSEVDRNFLTARYLLENPDSGIEAVKAAVYDVTKDTSLRFAIERIEIFRENGLFTRINDECSKVTAKLDKALKKIEPSSPTVATLLEKRFSGTPPSRQTGRVRTEGFISRVLSAGENETYNTMTLHDAEEIFTLAYELLANRDIPMLQLKYTGSKEFTKTSEDFDSARITFRKAAYLRNSKLRELAELFSSSEIVNAIPAASSSFTTLDIMYESIIKAIDKLYKELNAQQGIKPVIFQKTLSPQEQKKKLKKLDTAIKLHKALSAATNNMNKYYGKLQKAEDRYNWTRENSAKKIPLHFLKQNETGPGIKINHKHIILTRSNKKHLALGLEKFFQTFDNSTLSSTEKYKKLAIDISMLLDKYLEISKFNIQYAIESSNATYISSLKLNLNAATKAGMALSIVKEVQKNIQAPIHRIAYSLVNYHSLSLDSESINYLVEKYGADSQLLHEIAPNANSDFTGNDPERIPQLLHIQQLDKKYQKIINYALSNNLL